MRLTRTDEFRKDAVRIALSGKGNCYDCEYGIAA